MSPRFSLILVVTPFDVFISYHLYSIILTLSQPRHARSRGEGFHRSTPNRHLPSISLRLHSFHRATPRCSRNCKAHYNRFQNSLNTKIHPSLLYRSERHLPPHRPLDRHALHHPNTKYQLPRRRHNRRASLAQRWNLVTSLPPHLRISHSTLRHLWASPSRNAEHQAHRPRNWFCQWPKMLLREHNERFHSSVYPILHYRAIPRGPAQFA